MRWPIHDWNRRVRELNDALGSNCYNLDASDLYVHLTRALYVLPIQEQAD